MMSLREGGRKGKGRERDEDTRNTFQEEGIVCVAGRVLLWLEKRIEVPERALYVVVRGHFFKAHTDKDLTDL